MLEIYKGDDTDFAELRTLAITISTELDLTGFTGKFVFLGVTKTFTAEEIQSKTVSVVYTQCETNGFVPGQNYGTFHLYDTEGRHAAVYKILVDVVLHRKCSPSPNEISISIENVYDYNKLGNVPTIDGIKITGDKDAHEYGLAKLSDILTNQGYTKPETRAFIGPDWDSSKTYAEGDYCIYEDKIFRCDEPVGPSQTFPAGDFIQIVLTGELEFLRKELLKKVDKEEGKGLSSNDYTNADKEKLSGIESGAQKNVQANWEEDDPTSEAFIKNKPTIGPSGPCYISEDGFMFVPAGKAMMEGGSVQAYRKQYFVHVDGMGYVLETSQTLFARKDDGQFVEI